MKTTDFNVTTWENGSRGNIYGTGTYGGKKYQVKIHASEPTWNMVEDKITAKKDELKRGPAPDIVDTKTWEDRIKGEIASLESRRASMNAADKISDDYLAYKQRLVKAIASIGSDQLVCPAEYWKERIASKGNGYFIVEATPWETRRAADFDGNYPVDFNKDLSENEQYDVIASMCEQLAKLHNAGIMHGDLKRGNTIVIKKDGKFQSTIIDYDASVILNDLYSKKMPVGVWYHIMGGTFFAPEMYMVNSARANSDADAWDGLDLKEVTTKADIFALGVTIYEYFFGLADGAKMLPLVGPDGEKFDTIDGVTCAEYGFAVAQNFKPDFASGVNDLLYGALNWMLAAKPEDRPTADQVRQIFATRKTDIIPSQYVRNPLWEAHRDKYEICPLPAGVSIRTGYNLRYVVKNGPIINNRSIDELVDMGYVKLKGDAAAPEQEYCYPPHQDVPLPPCVKKGYYGKYALYARGTSTGGLTFEQLAARGYFCTEAEMKTPWPCDKDLKFSASDNITRDMSQGHGEGYYNVGTTQLHQTVDMLKTSGKVTQGIHFNLNKYDAVEYEPDFDNIPATVKSVSPSPVFGQYNVTTTTGVQRMTKAEMLAKGYIKKK